ncbi:MAG TPA: hypothetical protein VFW16_16410 [Streptosporangiaceae bacterium]|nr:hypothetical protein [Streptosporangiaceae bacterium]
MLGAGRGHIGAQFVAEAALLGGAGGLAGALLGGFATALYSWTRHWNAVVPVPVLLAAVGSRWSSAPSPACTPHGVPPASHMPRR